MCCGERFHISHPMHEPGLHVSADLGAGFRGQGNASAAHRFRDYQPESLLDARQNEDIALPHQVGHVGPMPEDTDTGMRQHGGQFVSIGRQKFSGDQKFAILARRRSQPSFQRIVDTFSHCADPDKQHCQTALCLPPVAGRVVGFLIKPVEVPNQLLFWQSPYLEMS